MATTTATVTTRLLATVTKTVTSSSATSTVRAAAQAGVLAGLNPSVYNPTNPIILFIIQATIIVVFCRLLHYPLRWLRQPKVIAEVIGGILLGPSVMGRIPGFTDAIFPTAAMPNLTLVATLGLVLFLFIVGLEVDLRYFVSNWRPAVSVSLAGLAIPFGLGCAISVGLYNQFSNDPGTLPIAFPTFMLFIGVAISITAFPVLCRILTELQLLSTPVGTLVLSAGVGNDVVGWILLALCVALVNADSGLTALWVLLTCLGYALFLSFLVRPAFLWFLRRTRSLENGPSQTVVTVTLLMALGSAFFTGIIGVHPIFGAFMAGLICPHEGGFAIAVTEKVEDLIGALFLPLYFALSGLSTNLGLLNDGITWAYVIAIIVVAFTGKFVACTLAAKANGLVWRESFTIGTLMSCKGLVELIVLNIGLQAKVLTTRTFTMFVVMALFCTFITTPLTSLLYPPWYQRKLEAWRRGEIEWDGSPGTNARSSVDETTMQKFEAARIRKILVYLRLDNLPTTLSFVSLLGSGRSNSVPRNHPRLEKTPRPSDVARVNEKKVPVEVHGLRLLELTDRGSAVMKVSEVDEYTLFDPVLNAFRVLGKLYHLVVSGQMSIAPESAFAETLVTKAKEETSDLVLIPWSATGSISEAQNISHDTVRNRLGNAAFRGLVAHALDSPGINAAVLINRSGGDSLRRPSSASALTRALSGRSPSAHHEHFTVRPDDERPPHIFLPFLGGADSRAALRLVLQLAENPEMTATIIHYPSTLLFSDPSISEHGTPQTITVTPKTAPPTTTALASSSFSTAAHPQDSSDSDAVFFATLQRSLPTALESRVLFDSAPAQATYADLLQRAKMETSHDTDLVVLGRGALESGSGAATASAGSAVGGASVLGMLADALLDEPSLRAGLVVVKGRMGGE